MGINRQKSVSPEKLAANRANARKSTGPRTEAGKNKSSRNSWRHGFFAKRLFATPEQQAQEGKEYELLLNAVLDHYRPVGLWEELWTERIAVELFRSANILSHEQGILNGLLPFEMQAIDRILRYQAACNRQLAQVIEQLERLQEVRRAIEEQEASSHLEIANPSRGQNEVEEQSEDEDQLPAGHDLSPSVDCGTNPTNSSEASDPIGVSSPIENYETNPTPGQELLPRRPVDGQGLGPDRRRAT